MPEKPKPTAYTSREFQVLRKALLACSDADRAFFRRWAMNWIDDQGRIRHDAPELPTHAVSD